MIRAKGRFSENNEFSQAPIVVSMILAFCLAYFEYQKNQKFRKHILVVVYALQVLSIYMCIKSFGWPY